MRTQLKKKQPKNPPPPPSACAAGADLNTEAGLAGQGPPPLPAPRPAPPPRCPPRRKGATPRPGTAQGPGPVSGRLPRRRSGGPGAFPRRGAAHGARRPPPISGGRPGPAAPVPGGGPDFPTAPSGPRLCGGGMRGRPPRRGPTTHPTGLAGSPRPHAHPPASPQGHKGKTDAFLFTKYIFKLT